jgi:hypothetical protein
MHPILAESQWLTRREAECAEECLLWYDLTGETLEHALREFEQRAHCAGRFYAYATAHEIFSKFARL